MTPGSPPAATASVRMRGFERLRDPHVWGTTVGAAGGTVFVMANRGELAHPWPTVAMILWAGAFAGYVCFVFLVPRVFEAPRPPAPHAGLIYLSSVVGMLALIRIGTILADDAGRSSLRSAIIVVAVGLHFLPFASAFHTPMFKTLGSAMVTLGAAGFALGWAQNDSSAAAAAVISGIMMLAVIAADAARRRA